MRLHANNSFSLANVNSPFLAIENASVPPPNKQKLDFILEFTSCEPKEAVNTLTR